MKKLLALSITALMATGTAQAGSLGRPLAEPMVMAPAPTIAAMRDWTGAYAGLGLGFGRGHHTPDAPNTLPGSSGFVAGGLLGYNWQNGTMVFGAEGSGLLGRIRGNAACATPGFECTSRVNNLIALRGRIGVTNADTLFFVTLGPALGSVQHTASDGVATFTASHRLRGAVLGAGVEHAFRDGWNLRGEIEHYRFRSRDYGLNVMHSNVRSSVTLARVSAVMRF
ncbi:MAG: outer membrane protein [Pararhodobacter sp.]